MSTMLNFKYGLHRNLPAYDSAKVGSIYVTTDEQAMYVDLPAGRIRVSQLITLSGIEEWQKLTPPYSTEAFYYIADANALLKYSGKEWVQINSTKAISDALDEFKASVDADFIAVNSRLDSHDTDITTLKSNVSQLQGDVQDLHGTVNNHDARLEIAEGNITTLQNDLASEIATRAEKDTKHDTDIAELQTKLAEEINRSTAKDDELDAAIKAEASRADAAEKVNAAAIAANTAAIEQEVADRKAADTNLQEQITSNDNDITKLQNDLSQETTDRKAADVALEAKITTNAESIASNKAAIDQEVLDRKTAIQELQDRIDQGGTNLTDLQNKLDQEIADRKAKDTEFEKGISDNAANIASNAAAIATNKEAFDAEVKRSTEEDQRLAGLIQTNTTNISTNKSAIDQEIKDRAAADAALQSAIDTEIEERKQAVKDLTDTVTSNMQTADAMKFMGTVSSAAELLSKEEGAEVGHTYKAVAEFMDGDVVTISFANDDEKVYIGDLLIASGTEVDGKITGEVTWLHVPSGYTADYNPELSVADGGNNSATVSLTSGAASGTGDLGNVVFEAAADSCVTVSSNGTNVVVGMAWGTF